MTCADCNQSSLHSVHPLHMTLRHFAYSDIKVCSRLCQSCASSDVSACLAAFSRPVAVLCTVTVTAGVCCVCGLGPSPCACKQSGALLHIFMPRYQLLCAGMFAKQNAQSTNPKVRLLAAEKRVTSAEAAVQRAERDLERAAESAKQVKPEPAARVRRAVLSA